MAVQDADQEKTSILLHGRDLSLLPFLHINNRYSFSGLKPVKFTDSNNQSATELVHVSNKHFRIRSEISNTNVGSTNSAQICCKLLSPTSTISIELLSRKTFTIECVVTKCFGPDWLEVLTRVETAPAVVCILTTHFDFSVLRSSIRKGAVLIFYNIYPIYLWGKLMALAALNVSRVEIVKFAKSPIMNLNPLAKIWKSRFSTKCLFYIAWRAVTFKMFEQSFESPFYFPDAISLLETVFDTNQFEIKKMVSPLTEFFDRHYVPLYYIQAGHDIDWISSFLPMVRVNH